MKFVLCSEQTYQEKYQPEAYKYVKIQDHTDLVGYPQIHVYIHDCWMYEINDDRVDYLEQQLVALADFGYIKITYINEDGWEENYEYKEVAPVKLQKEIELPEPVSEGVVAYEIEDDGCEGGACKI